MRKSILCLLLFSVLFSPARAQERAYPASFTVRLTNDVGEPISDYPVKISTFSHWKPGTGFGTDYYDYETKKTAANGMVYFEYPSKRGRFGINLYPAPDQYYITWPPHYEFDEVVNGRWVPENPTIEVVLKRIKNPIPMYAKEVGPVRPLDIPVLGKEVGFDLMEADWVVPYGTGRVSDFIFKMERRFVSVYDFDSTFAINFSNDRDGIISARKPVHQGSELRLDYEAPKDGYMPSVLKRAYAHPPSKLITTGIDPDQNYYFRVRTVLDKNGKIESAHYGKIHGDFGFARFRDNRGVQFRYYLNPTPNDRNLEFDPERNLFPGEDINEP